MVIKQGDIIKLDLDPTLGHEQKGYRPALIISNDQFNTRTKMAIILPITNTDKGYPLHVRLDSRTKTTGVILCEHMRSIDPEARNHQVVEALPKDLFERVIGIVMAEIDEGV